MSWLRHRFGDGELRDLKRGTVSIGGREISTGSLWGLLTIVPVVLLYLVVAVVPIGYAIVASLFEIPLLNPEWSYVGLGNYEEVLTLDDFWGAMGRGVIYMVASTVFQTVVGVWIALVLNKATRGKRILYTFVFNAYLIPTIIIAILAKFLFDPFVGLLHVIGAEELGLWSGYIFGNTDLAMTAVVLIGSWKFSIFVTILTLAQLQSIPDQFYEMAKTCGAGSWEMFRDVTFPRLKGVLLVAILLRSIFMFNKFDIIFQLTRGGPGDATTTMPVLAYNITFQGLEYGLGNAVAVVMFVFLAIGGVLYFKWFNPSEEVET